MHIAVVDPSRTIRKAVARTIEPWGYQVTGVPDGPDALNVFSRETEIRTLIISSELPSGSGITFCGEARKLCGTSRPLYVLLMSSQTDKLIPALHSGADDFISKPPSSEELRARLRTAERVTEMQAELISRATTDYLTGTMTRRKFFETAAQRWAAAPREFCVLICDLDNFKYVNDRHGHEIGDKLLVEVGKTLLATGEHAGRLGGEEFAVLYNGNVNQGIELATWIRDAVARITIAADTGYVRPTCSIGLAEYAADQSIECMLNRADTALYQAKSAGRNRVVAASTESSPLGRAPREFSRVLKQAC